MHESEKDVCFLGDESRRKGNEGKKGISSYIRNKISLERLFLLERFVFKLVSSVATRLN